MTLPHLKIFQSVWGMERQHPDGVENSLETNLRLIQEAGFEGISITYEDADLAGQAAEFLKAHGMTAQAMCLPTSVDALKPVLETAAKYGADHINAQPNVRPRSLKEGVQILEGWMRLSEEAGIPVYIETHRDRMTNDLFFTFDLLKALPELRLTADLSHYVVAREFPDPPRQDNHEDIRTILDRSHAIHGRVAGPGQIQLPLSFPHHRAWVDRFLGWWEYGFQSWINRAGPDEILTFTCELGPRPYAMTGSNGRDLSDRWQEALLLRDLVRKLWHGIHEASDSTSFAYV